MVRLNDGIKFNRFWKAIVVDFSFGCYSPWVTQNRISLKRSFSFLYRFSLSLSVCFCQLLLWFCTLIGKVASNQTELENKESSYSSKQEKKRKPTTRPPQVTAGFQHLSGRIHRLKREITGLWNTVKADFCSWNIWAFSSWSENSVRIELNNSLL